MSVQQFDNTPLSTDFTMYIAAHKPFEVPDLLGYQPIEVGAALREEPLGYLADNSGDEISNKNKTFCEMTAHYWIWKNSRSKIVGLSHYRRYFSRSRVVAEPKKLLSAEEAIKILDEYDLILPEPFYWKHHNVRSGYDAGFGFENDLDKLREIIANLTPEYLEPYDVVLSQNEASYCNMLVASKPLFDKYSEWVFRILFELERQLDISKYSGNEVRVYGYMAEILLNVWVKKERLNAYYYPMCNLGAQGKKYRLLRHLDRVPVLNKTTKILNCVDAIM